MADEELIGTPGTYEFSAPDGMLRAEWIGSDEDADRRAREHAERLEKETGGEFLVTRIRRRTEAGWEDVNRTPQAA
ncbi:hypothetical protein [Kitasatospora camelliae]|uniref:DUF2188 domain-containing protein n=1 Tax=Kitasatospora camelliae TaxID=3156397 RepID=A0AAU8K1H4_9ACTN